MELSQAILRRYSVRDYQRRQLSAEQTAEIMQAGQRAATSRGKEARRFIWVSDPAIRRQLQQQAKMQEFVADAAVVVVGVATNKDSTGSVYDVVISLAQMELAAVSLGLGTCWLGVYDGPAAAELLGVPVEAKIASMLAIGYSASAGEPRAKLPLEQLFFQNGHPE